MSVSMIIQNVKIEAKRVGYPKAVGQLLYYLINKFLSIRKLELIILKPESLIPLDESKYNEFSTRRATLDELVKMKSDGNWMMTDELIKGYQSGDLCLLSLVKGQIAGYTWLHTDGHPRFFDGLTVSIPKEYAYNFAGYTLPEFRGYGMQPYRHHTTLMEAQSIGKTGLIGFVEVNNFSSKKGQAKSGYRPLGLITTFGTHSKFLSVFSDELKQIGIKRL